MTSALLYAQNLEHIFACVVRLIGTHLSSKALEARLKALAVQCCRPWKTKDALVIQPMLDIKIRRDHTSRGDGDVFCSIMTFCASVHAIYAQNGFPPGGMIAEDNSLDNRYPSLLHNLCISRYVTRQLMAQVRLRQT